MVVEKKVYKNSAIYTACNFTLKAMNFLLLPLYTAFLSTTDFGIIGLMDQFISVATVLSTLSLQAAVMRFYMDYRSDEQGLPRFIGTLICFTFLSTLTFDTVFFLLRIWLVPTLFKGISFIPTVAITLSSLVFTNIYGIYQQVLRGMEQAKNSAITSIAYLLLNICFTILYVVGFRMGASGSLLGTATAGLCVSIFSIGHLTRLGVFRICIDWEIVHDLLKYSIPLMPHNLSTQIAQLLSGMLINNGGSLSAVGLYNVASKFGLACDTLQSSVSTAYQPWLFRMLEERTEGYKTQIISFTSTLLDVYTLVFSALGLFIREPILVLLDKSYAPSWMLVPPIVLVYAVKSAYYFYIAALFYHKEATKRIFIATLSSSVLNVLLTIWLVPLWGAYGSVLADGVSMSLRVGLVVWMSSRYEDSGYRMTQFIVPFLSILIILTIGLVPCYANPYEVSLPLFFWRFVLYLGLFMMFLFKHKDISSSIRARLTRRR